MNFRTLIGCFLRSGIAVVCVLAPACSPLERVAEPKSQEAAPAPVASAAAPPSSPRFTDYVVDSRFTGTPAAPVLSSPDARRFRTEIRQDAGAGPNFAGHYTIALWGCGSTCMGFAVVDARTGEVSFHPRVSRVWQVAYQTDSVLEFPVRTALPVIAGETAGPEGSNVGKYFYEWKDRPLFSGGGVQDSVGAGDGDDYCLVMASCVVSSFTVRFGSGSTFNPLHDR